MTARLRMPGRVLLVALVATLSVGCSKRSSAPIEEPWVTEGETMRGDATAGGIATTYSAYFKDEQLERIIETRTSSANARGEYIFTGARLTSFKGDAIDRDAQIEIELDMRGAATHANNATPEDIAAVRNRAQLLRSLVLSRRATMTHSEAAQNPPASH